MTCNFKSDEMVDRCPECGCPICWRCDACGQIRCDSSIGVISAIHKDVSNKICNYINVKRCKDNDRCKEKALGIIESRKTMLAEMEDPLRYSTYPDPVEP